MFILHRIQLPSISDVMLNMMLLSKTPAMFEHGCTFAHLTISLEHMPCVKYNKVLDLVSCCEILWECYNMQPEGSQPRSKYLEVITVTAS